MIRISRRICVEVGVVILIAIAFAIVILNPYKGPVLIAGDQAVTEGQVREKLQSDGWTNIRIVRDGRYFQITASKNDRDNRLEVDSQTGRLRPDDGDDD